MVVNFDWSGGLVFGLAHTDMAVIEMDDDDFRFTNAILLHLGFITISIVFFPVEDGQE